MEIAAWLLLYLSAQFMVVIGEDRADDIPEYGDIDLESGYCILWHDEETHCGTSKQI